MKSMFEYKQWNNDSGRAIYFWNNYILVKKADGSNHMVSDDLSTTS